MIKVIVGLKGSGKTARLVDEMNLEAMDSGRIVVCIVRGKRLETQIKPQIRLIDVDDYPTEGYHEFMSFLAGICSKDYDLTDIYVDSIEKVTKTNDVDQFSDFLRDLEPFSEKQNVNFTFILSADPNALPEGIRRFC